MTTGEQLIKKLGLEKVHKNNIYICRFISNFSNKVNIIYYSSLRKLSKHETERVPYSAYLTPGYELERGNLRKMFTTPLVDIKVFNGIVSNRLFMMVDMAYVKLLDKKNFSKLPESNQKKILWNGISYFYGKNLLKEYVTLADLSKNQAISNFTIPFQKQRSSTMGAEANIAKLADVDIGLKDKDDSITFFWITQYTKTAYPKKHKVRISNPKKNFKLTIYRPKNYTLMIKVLDFYKWLDTYPDKTEITTKDIKDIFSVSNVQVFSNSPSLHWQGFNFQLSQIDGAIFPTNIAPTSRKTPNGKEIGWKNRTSDGFLDKHLQSLINGIKFWYSPMASMLTKRLKDRNII